MSERRGVQGNKTSSNWAGYVVTGAAFTDVVGSWTVPTASCGGAIQYASVWVGLDGYTTGDKGNVEQAGTDADCLKGTGKKKKVGPIYFGWFDLYPARAVQFSSSSCPVAPGDSMTGEVSSSGDQFTLTLTDATEGWQCSSPPETSSAQGSSAEWIVEAPINPVNNQLFKLDDFGSVSFSGAAANGTSVSGLEYDQITMRAGKTVKASASALGSDGASFTVGWLHS